MHKFFTSRFIIDGIPLDGTPLDKFRELLPEPLQGLANSDEEILDESIDPEATPDTFSSERIDEYACAIEASEGVFPFGYSRFAARKAVCEGLLGSISASGHFSLVDLRVSLLWKWNSSKIGAMASFWASCESAAEYLQELGTGVDSLEYEEAPQCSLTLTVTSAQSKEDVFDAFDSADISFGSSHLVSRTASCDPSSWIIYIPFDTCKGRLGGSAISRLAGNDMEGSAEISDSDYFMDCYEVAREMVEDGVIKALVPISRGGLLCAARSLCGAGGSSQAIEGGTSHGSAGGLDMNLSGIEASQKEDFSLKKALFAEVPGLVVQISDIDYDYVDGQFLLQDIAYYPLGHPKCGDGRVSVEKSSRRVISEILSGILAASSPEGED